MGQLVPILELGIGRGLSVPSGSEPWGTHTSWEQEELFQSGSFDIFSITESALPISRYKIPPK